MNTHMEIIIHTDGGARGNPGPAAIGVVIQKITGAGKLETVVEFGKKIGECTNNVAEYLAVIEALTFLKKHPIDENKKYSITFFLDSLLVVNQINGIFKVKEAHLRELLVRIRILQQESGGGVQYISVPREKNRRADFFVNQALDGVG